MISDSANQVIVCDRVQFMYNQGQKLPEFNLSIKEGALTGIIGPNGTGKTTFLKLVSKLLPPTQGSVTITSQSIGFLNQRNFFDIHFPINVFEVVSMGLYPKYRWLKYIDKYAKQRIFDALEEVGLTKLMWRNIGHLSGGQFQRAIFARLMVQDPDLILLDEPFNAVDCLTFKILTEQIQKWHDRGKTILCVMHDIIAVRQMFKECIVIAQDAVKHVPMDSITDEFLAQVFFCGRHAGAHDVV